MTETPQLDAMDRLLAIAQPRRWQPCSRCGRGFDTHDWQTGYGQGMCGGCRTQVELAAHRETHPECRRSPDNPHGGHRCNPAGVNQAAYETIRRREERLGGIELAKRRRDELSP